MGRYIDDGEKVIYSATAPTSVGVGALWKNTSAGTVSGIGAGMTASYSGTIWEEVNPAGGGLANQIYYFADPAPSGYLLCDGQSTTGYPNLIAAFGANVPSLHVPSAQTLKVVGQSVSGTDLLVAGFYSFNGVAANCVYSLATSSGSYKVYKYVFSTDTTTLLGTLGAYSGVPNYTSTCTDGTDFYVLRTNGATSPVTVRVDKVTQAGVITTLFTATIATNGSPGFDLTTSYQSFCIAGGDFYLSVAQANTSYPTITGYRIIKITSAGIVSTFTTVASAVPYYGFAADPNGFLVASTYTGELLIKIDNLGVSTTLASSVGINAFIRYVDTTIGYELAYNNRRRVTVAGVLQPPTNIIPYEIVSRHGPTGRYVGTESVISNQKYFVEAVNTASSKPYVKAS